jgi:hypothetical protein
MPVTTQDYARKDKRGLVARIRGLDSFEDLKELVEAVVAVLDQAVSAQREVRTGRAGFDSSSDATVTLTEPMADASYSVALAPPDNRTAWVTDKTATGFLVHVSAAMSGEVDWTATHD